MRRLLPTLAALFFCVSATAAAQTLERGYEDRTMRGPGTAQGAVIYSPGLVREGTPITATPYVVDDLQAAGWDVFRFVPPSAGDIVEVAAAALTDAAQELRGRSYKRIVLIGQSYGGWLSLAAAGGPGEPVDAVAALAPAAFGARGESENWTANASALAPLAEAVTAKRVLVFLFRGDEYDPGGRAATLRDIFARRGLAAAEVVDEPPGLVGHSAGLTRAFARRFGPCLRDFIDAADAPTAFRCAEPGWAAMADFGVPADLATVTPPAGAAAGAASMAGRWYGVYDTGREVLFIVRRIDGERAEAVYAFGPIIRGVDAPSGLAKGGLTQRHGTFDPATGTLRFAEPEADTIIECHLQADGGLAFSLARKSGGEPLHAVLRTVE
jgi:dienelactone hydrolase